ncbi:MAG: DUF3500 domain-containing protein [Isosphaeraceae bacterium]
MNLTLDKGKIVAATPAFFGSNPAEVARAAFGHSRPWAIAMAGALRLVQALDDSPRRGRRRRGEGPRRHPGRQHHPSPARRAPVGIAYRRPQGRPAGHAQGDRRGLRRRHAARGLLGPAFEIKKAGVDGIKFAWFGPADRSQGHAYRIQGPTFLVEFNNTQNNANHVHSVWRNMLGDFGNALAAK